MAERVSAWDSETREWGDSEREYTECRVEVYRESNGTFSRVDAYADSETGIVTIDVAGFERWLSRVQKEG